MRKISKKAHPAAEAATEQSVGEAVRRLRESQRISVRAFAAKAGFSPSFISQVEKGQASPSINSLERVASCLGVTLGQFFNALEPRDEPVTRASDRRQLRSGWSKAKIESLGTSGSGTAIEPILVTLAAGGSSGKTPYALPYEEFNFMLDGELTLTIDAEEYILTRGDSAIIPADRPRRLHNHGTKPGCIIIVSVRKSV